MSFGPVTVTAVTEILTFGPVTVTAITEMFGRVTVTAECA